MLRRYYLFFSLSFCLVNQWRLSAIYYFNNADTENDNPCSLVFRLRFNPGILIKCHTVIIHYIFYYLFIYLLILIVILLQEFCLIYFNDFRGYSYCYQNVFFIFNLIFILFLYNHIIFIKLFKLVRLYNKLY